MRRFLLLTFTSAAVLMAGCSDQPTPEPLGPDDVTETLDGKKPPAGCLSPSDQQLADAIRADIDDLFIGKGGKTPAKELLSNIERKLCEEDFAAALEMAWGFLGLITEKNPDGFSGDATDASELANDVFDLVGSSFEIPEGAFDEETGGIHTFDPDEVTLPFVAGTGNNEAAVVIDAPNIFPPGTGDVTIVLARAPGNLVVQPGAYIPGFQAFEEGYEILSSHQPWPEGPGVLVALCAVPPLPTDAVIGHLHEESVSLLVPTDPDPQTLGYIDCTDVEDTTTGGEETFLSSISAPSWVQGARKALEPVVSLFEPQPLQADVLAFGVAGPGLGGRTQSLSLNAPVDPVIDVEESVQLSVGTDATWESSDENVATVDSDGVVTGVGSGTSTITATFSGISGPESLSIVITVEGEFGVAPGLIVFTSERDENEEIYVMNSDGSGQTNLTENGAADREPAWSPFGTRIAFVSDRSEVSRIYTMDADGSNLDGPFGVSGASWPAWSPDGTQIAYIAEGAVHVMNSNGTFDEELPTVEEADLGLDWSPEGSQIVVSDAGNLVIVNSDGTGTPSVVSSGANEVDGFPAYSPDGNQIAFYRVEVEVEPGEIYVWTFNAESTDNLSNTEGSDDGYPSWSTPSESEDPQIVFWSNRTEDDRILVMDANGANQTEITDGGSDYDPDWQPPVIIIN